MLDKIYIIYILSLKTGIFKFNTYLKCLRLDKYFFETLKFIL